MTQIMVVNSGTHPELMHLAASEFGASVDVRYLSSTMLGRNSLLVRLATSAGLNDRDAFQARLLPESLADSHCYGLPLEAVHLLSRRYTPKWAPRALGLRNRYFESRASRHVKSDNPEIVVAQQTTAHRVFSANRSALKILNYPIAHHRWAKQYMLDETRHNPTWAAHAQGADLSPQASHTLDAEVESADLILLASSFARRTFEESGVSAKKLHVIPLGAVPASTLPVEREREGHPLRVLFAGQVNQRKGISYLVEAVSRLGPKVELRVVGPITNQMRASLARAGINDVTGAVSQNQMRSHYAWADVIALPSLIEGFGLTALEAMSWGCVPVITSHTFGEDIVTHGASGLVGPPRDAVWLEEALDGLSGNLAAVSRMSREAAAVGRTYSWQRYESKTKDWLEELMRGIGRG